jgi:alkylation response protein AidB-like acyl-CoA dehydrogenase
MPKLSAEEQLFGDTAVRLLTECGGVDRARRLRDSWPAVDRATIRRMAELGWFGLLVPEDLGGTGGTARDMVVLLDHVGGLLPPEPIGQAIAAAAMLAQARTASAMRWCEQIVSGDVICALAHPPVSAAPGLPSAAADSLIVRDGHVADILLAACGDTTCVVDAKRVAKTSDLAFDMTVDGGSIGALRLTHVAAKWTRFADQEHAPLGESCRQYAEEVDLGPQSARMWTDALDLVRLATAALLAGLAGAALSRTLDYMRQRRQFGVPIGSFQALQHRAASLHVAVTSTRALVYEAARAVGGPRQGAACAAAKGRAADTTLAVVKDCVQLHGAIGFADAHAIGLFLRRAMTLASMFGNAAADRRRFLEIP